MLEDDVPVIESHDNSRHRRDDAGEDAAEPQARRQRRTRRPAVRDAGPFQLIARFSIPFVRQAGVAVGLFFRRHHGNCFLRID